MSKLRFLPVTEEDTDFILSLQELPEVQKNFPRKEKITKEMHLKFLKKIGSLQEPYWIIKFNGERVGTVGFHGIDRDKKESEWGRYIIVPEYRYLARAVELKILDLAFNFFGYQRIYCSIMPHNKSVIKIRELLGYNKYEENDFIWMEMTYDNYRTLYHSK